LFMGWTAALSVGSGLAVMSVLIVYFTAPKTSAHLNK
jgi:hypothetical protein